MGPRVGVDGMEKRDVSYSPWDLDPGFISLLSSCCLLLKESAACYKL